MDCDQSGIVIDSVYLRLALEPPFDLLDPLQPLQGRFPNIVSTYEKNSLEKTG
jgi:hypothetical protein